VQRIEQHSPFGIEKGLSGIQKGFSGTDKDPYDVQRIEKHSLWRMYSLLKQDWEGQP